MRMLKSLINNMALSVAILFLTVVVTEIILRFTHHKSLVGYAIPQGYFKYDGVAGYDISENFPRKYLYFSDSKHLIWSNELGCFDKPYKGEKDYILLTGDSFTWGFTPFKYNYGTLIEDYLGYRVLKCGVLGYGTKQELLKIKKVMERVGKPPQLIIVAYFLKNDFEDDWLFPKNTVIDGKLVQKNKIVNAITWEKEIISDEDLKKKTGDRTTGIKSWLRTHSIICNLILRSNVYKNFRPVRKMRGALGMLAKRTKIYTPIFYQIKEYPYLKNAWEDHLGNLREIKKLSDKNSAKLLIILVPPKEQVYDCFKSPYDLEKFNKMLKDFFDAEKIDCLDMIPYFRAHTVQKASKYLSSKTDLYWRYDQHCNRRGHKVLSLGISKYIIDHNLIDLVDRYRKEKKIEEELDTLKSEKNRKER